MSRFLALLLALPALSASAGESSWDLSSNVEVESRFFADDGQWHGQSTQAGAQSIAASAELRWRSASGSERASLIPYLRWDSVDAERSLADLREAYVAWEGDGWEFLAGANTVFWGVTESVHLVDIVNQIDAAGDIDGELKLGQPMLNLELQRDWGLFSAYLLPYFRERTFPGSDGRLRTPLPVDTNQAVFESGDDESHVDVALRYSHYLGAFDFGVSAFIGTSREPRLLPDQAGRSLTPYYDLIEQAGLDLQYTGDAWLWKLESIVRRGYSHTFAAAVAGFEYTLYQVAGSAADVGILLEYQYDGRNELEPFTIADNDVFVATRFALNDVQDTAILAGVAWDTKSGETFLNIEAERRFGQNYLVELRIRAFSSGDPGEPVYAIRSDDYVQLRLERFF
jgi:hypothetical protein